MNKLTCLNSKSLKFRLYYNIIETLIWTTDAEAVVEALEFLRSNNHGVLHSYDAINNQENDDLQSQTQNDSNDLKESFNNQISDHLAPSTELQPAGEITTYNQPLEISKVNFWKPVRSLNTQQCKAYDIVLS